MANGQSAFSHPHRDLCLYWTLKRADGRIRSEQAAWNCDWHGQFLFVFIVLWLARGVCGASTGLETSALYPEYGSARWRRGHLKIAREPVSNYWRGILELSLPFLFNWRA
ncbi:hypothetical protein PoB_005558100 [Plakobranchus ocellatus]|uniref:Uncharacterized protein n=1 Tax=Plakobranchus ocellatus TaxID=259542 RepID=A0AAV4C8N5_9GAST|nr:hypothetical protein PoB_005558100 [Plakobranchus ocellatus]